MPLKAIYLQILVMDGRQGEKRARGPEVLRRVRNVPDVGHKLIYCVRAWPRKQKKKQVLNGKNGKTLRTKKKALKKEGKQKQTARFVELFELPA